MASFLLSQSRNQIASGLELDARAGKIVAHRLRLPAQVPGQEHFGDRKESAPVLLSAEAVSLVGIIDVTDRDAARLHRCDDLLRLRRLHPHVVCALTNEQRAYDAADVIERRALLQEFLAG